MCIVTCKCLQVDFFLPHNRKKTTITESFQYFDKEYLILDKLVVSRLFLLIFGLKNTLKYPI